VSEIEMTRTKRLDQYPNRRYTEVTYSIPKELLERIDNERGEVSRSRFVLRLIEKGYSKAEQEEDKQE
jgi:metal-responsive CopG/Arc/MetJ family transcriptional regulator